MSKHHCLPLCRLSSRESPRDLKEGLTLCAFEVKPEACSRTDWVSFNCQMGRGRTTTGMIVASLIATIQLEELADSQDLLDGEYTDGDSTDASQYLNGEWASGRLPLMMQANTRRYSSSSPFSAMANVGQTSC